MAESNLIIPNHEFGILTKKQQREIEIMSKIGNTPLSQLHMALISRTLMLCPLPFERTEEFMVTRETRIPGGSIETTISRMDRNIFLPFGYDAYLLDIITNEARRRKTPIVETRNMIDIMHLMGLENNGGSDYLRFMHSIERIGAFGIRVKRKGYGAINANIVNTDMSEFWLNNLDYNPKKLKGKKVPFVLRLSSEFFNDLMNHYYPIPLEILDVFSDNPTAYSMAKWLWWRADISKNQTLIEWDELAYERGSEDLQTRRFKSKVEKVITRMRPAKHDIDKIFNISMKGLLVTPLSSYGKGENAPIY